MTDVLMVLKTQNLKNDQRVLKEIRSLTQHGAKVEIFVTKNCEMTQEQLGHPIYDIKISGGAAPTNLILQFLGIFQFYIKFILFVINKKYKKFWVCDPIMFGLVLLIRSIKPTSKIIWDHHELPPSWFLNNKILMFFFKKAYSKADVNIHANEPRKNYLEGLLGIKSKVGYIISNYPESINIGKEALDEKGEDWLSKNKKFIYLQNCLQENRYGQQTIKAAISAGYKVFHAGKIESDYIEKYNLSDDEVFFAGYLSAEQINYVLEKCTFTIILYKQNSLNQTFCDANRLYQAMSLGVPIISGNNPTLVDATKDYKNCVILKDDGRDVESIRLAILELLSDISCREPKLFDWSFYDYVFAEVVAR
ncbi:glycosyltransferase [Acinetobacter haemolyticus]|uniref:glycosyltransferase n=1 Tax=Acinetobacter haemolyticus TaxID=29430 RepID=UPI0013735F85|nr:glycosyltransferase [Acinetobacter haemolyticus]NAS07488.1 glycosyl transferase family 1 [Acinetobacter haemolyticus]